MGYTRAKRSVQRPGRNAFTGSWWRRLRWLIGALAVCGSRPLPAEEVAVRTLPLGLFTVYAATEPFRLSWFYRDELLLADRYRRHDSAIEVLDAGGWRTLGSLLEAREERGEELGESRWRLRVGGAGAQEFVVLLSWLPTRAVATFSCTQVGGKAVGWRQDFVAQPEELTYGVRDATFTQLKGLGVSNDDATSVTPMRMAVSSRGFGVIIDGRAELADAFRPDPDTWRVQVRREIFAYTVVPGTPKAVLTARYRAIADDVERRQGQVGARRSEPLDAFVLPTETVATYAKLRATLPQELGAWLGRLPESPDGLPPAVPYGFEFPREPESWGVRGAWVLGGDVLVLAESYPQDGVFLPGGRWLRLGKDLKAVSVVAGPTRLQLRDRRGSPDVYVREGSAAASLVPPPTREE